MTINTYDAKTSTVNLMDYTLPIPATGKFSDCPENPMNISTYPPIPGTVPASIIRQAYTLFSNRSDEFTSFLASERVTRYRPGGFHPVHIDDTFNNRYRIIHKLGVSSYSTVWLVEDLEEKRFVSLKVISAEASLASSEVNIVRHLKLQQKQSCRYPGWEYVVQILDDFEIQDPNGTHQCIVTELMGPPIFVDLDRLYGFMHFELPTPIAKKIAGQVAQGVAYLHKCGIVHGDLNLGNILFYSAKFQNLSREEISLLYGDPICHDITRPTGEMKNGLNTTRPASPSPHRPRYMVSCYSDFPILKLCLSSPEDVHVKLCDFGEASLFSGLESKGNTPIELNMPRVMAAPEVLFEDLYTLTPPTEIWSLGILLHMILYGKDLPFSAPFGVPKYITPDIVQALGKFPDKWWNKWEDRAEFFDDDGAYIGPEHLVRERKTLADIPRYGFSQEEDEAFENALRKMMCYEMRDRITADEVVQLLPPGWK